MSFASFPKNQGGLGAAVSGEQTAVCVSIICLLASAPLLASIALMVWGG